MIKLPNPENVPTNATTPSCTAETGAPSSVPISMPFDEPPGDPDVTPNLRRSCPAAGQPRSPLNGFKGRAGTFASGVRRITQRRLELQLSRLQLGRDLGIEIATAVDVADEIALRQRGLLDRDLCLFSRASRCDRGSPSFLERAARGVEVLQHLLVLRDAIAVELGESGNGPRCLTDAAKVRC